MNNKKIKNNFFLNWTLNTSADDSLCSMTPNSTEKTLKINIHKSNCNSKQNKTETAVFGSTKLKMNNILHTVNR